MNDHRRKRLSSTPLLGSFVASVLLVQLSWGWPGAEGSSHPAAPPKPSEAREFRVAPDYFSPLRWRFVGPYRGGRSVAVSGHPTKPAVFFMGTTGGGIWKTEDAGQSWINVSDGFLRSSSLGAIAVSSSDPDVIYAGTGEACIRGNIAHGDGVYRSADSGKTWQAAGLENTRHIARIRIHPRDPNIVYVAALGDAWGPSVDRGVFRSQDGGRSWHKVLYRGEGAGAIDLSMDPGNPDTLYASLWDAQRFPWGLRSGGPDSSIYKTVDGGTTWAEITNRPGLPSETKGRIGIAVSPAKPTRVWAIVEADAGKTGLYVSDSGGESWQLINEHPSLAQRPFYYMHVVADPKDPDTVYVMNTGLRRSTDSGKTFSQIQTPHGDSHDLWIDPESPERMIEGNDGGGTVSLNGGRSWSSLLNQPTAQIYHVTTDNQFPYRIYGAQQDNTTISLPSQNSAGGIGQGDWYGVAGGEDGMIAVHPDDPNIVFSGDHHWVHRYDHRSQQIKSISPWPESYRGWGARDMKYRFNWMTPIVLSPHNPDVLYVAGNVLFRSTDQGRSWETISPDLTRQDESKLEPTPTWSNPAGGEFWGPITRDNTGVEWYCTISALAESPVMRGLLWVGADDGLVHVSRDGGRNWARVTPNNLPEWALISTIEPSRHDPATAYIAATRYKLQDLKPYLLKTSDYGESWTEITKGIPDSDFARVIREDPEKRGVLYAGTEEGVYVSFDDGAFWQSLRLNLPLVPVHDLAVKNGDLVAATHGRGFWILDDASPLSQFDVRATESAHLFKVRPTVRFRSGARVLAGSDDPSAPLAQNPPRGAFIHYYLPRSDEALELMLLDDRGEEIRTFSSGDGADALPNKSGMNRFVWNLRHAGPVALPGALYRPYLPVGPIVVPGGYQVRLKVGDQTHVERLEILPDPRIAVSDAEFAEQLALLMKIRDKISETHETVTKIRNLRREIDEFVRPASPQGSNDERHRLAQTVNDTLWKIEDALVQFRAKVPHALNNFQVQLMNKLVTLAGLVEMGDGAPTKQDYEAFAELSGRLQVEIEELSHVRENEIKKLYSLAKASGVRR